MRALGVCVTHVNVMARRSKLAEASERHKTERDAIVGIMCRGPFEDGTEGRGD
jgi:hypothetical protein